MTASAPPHEGDPAPDFELCDQRGERVSLSSLRGRWVVLYLYPRADTPGCTTQACGVRDHSHDYEAAGARVLGISPDSVEAIARFDRKHGLGFTLLADPDHEVAERYGAWVEKRNYGKSYWGVQRSTFIIDPEGTIAKVFPRVQPKQHDERVLASLGELAGAGASG